MKDTERHLDRQTDGETSGRGLTVRKANRLSSKLKKLDSTNNLEETLELVDTDRQMTNRHDIWATDRQADGMTQSKRLANKPCPGSKKTEEDRHIQTE